MLGRRFAGEGPLPGYIAQSLDEFGLKGGPKCRRLALAVGDPLSGGEICQVVWTVVVALVHTFVVAERKAIQSLRLRLRDGLRQSGSARCARAERPQQSRSEARGSGYLEAKGAAERHPRLKPGTTKPCPDDAW